MKTRFFICAVVGLAAFGSTAGYAACESALVAATYNLAQSSQLDWRAASLVDQKTYSELRRGGGVQATIYGIPMGANYADFQKNLSTLLQSSSQSLSKSEAMNMAWMGLTDSNVAAYSACLNAEVFSNPGLSAAVVRATATDISILVKWMVPGDARDANVSWDPGSIEGKPVPSTISQGGRTIIITRPSKEMQLAGNYKGYFTSPLVLTPPIPPLTNKVTLLSTLISSGNKFTVSIGPSLPNGHIGTLYPNRALSGTYTTGTKTWQVWGPNDVDGHFVNAAYCPSGCRGTNDGSQSPANHQIELWGAPFTFDESNNLMYGGSKVGTLAVE